MKNTESPKPSSRPFDLDLNNLLHPERAFAHPHDVVSDPDLTVNEKRAILASWASDASAVEAAPALRLGPGCSRPVPVDDILDALRALDNEAHGKAVEASWLRRQVRRRSIETFRARRRSEESRPRSYALRPFAPPPRRGGRPAFHALPLSSGADTKIGPDISYCSIEMLVGNCRHDRR